MECGFDELLYEFRGLFRRHEEISRSLAPHPPFVALTDMEVARALYVEARLREKECSELLENATAEGNRLSDFTVKTDLFKALEAVAFTTFDIIFVDKDLRGLSPEHFVRTIRRNGIRAPVYLLEDHPPRHISSGLALLTSGSEPGSVVDSLFSGKLFRPFSSAELCHIIDRHVEQVKPRSTKSPQHCQKRPCPGYAERERLNSLFAVPPSRPEPQELNRFSNDMRQLLQSMQTVLTRFQNHLRIRPRSQSLSALHSRPALAPVHQPLPAYRQQPFERPQFAYEPAQVSDSHSFSLRQASVPDAFLLNSSRFLDPARSHDSLGPRGFPSPVSLRSPLLDVDAAAAVTLDTLDSFDDFDLCLSGGDHVMTGPPWDFFP